VGETYTTPYKNNSLDTFRHFSIKSPYISLINCSRGYNFTSLPTQGNVYICLRAQNISNVRFLPLAMSEGIRQNKKDASGPMPGKSLTRFTIIQVLVQCRASFLQLIALRQLTESALKDNRKGHAPMTRLH
jgi:hypothetical protein